MISMILAMDEAGCIGRGDKLPWPHLPSDMGRFVRVTKGKSVLMGRKTWDGLPKRPLPGRNNIVVSKNEGFHPLGVLVVHDPRKILGFYNGREDPRELVVMGGAQVYALTLPAVRRAYITLVHDTFEGDVYAPFSLTYFVDGWRKTEEVFHSRDEKNPLDYTFFTFERTI